MSKVSFKSKKNSLVLISILVVLLLVVFLGKNGGGNVVNIGPTPTPTFTPTPTPFPIIINSSSDLVEEVDNLTPESFSDDFKSLRQEVSSF